MKHTLKINNVFGITPTTNCVAAGLDFYIPKFNADTDVNVVLNAFAKSYGKTFEEVTDIANKLTLFATSVFGEEKVNGNELNILHLYLSLTSICIDTNNNTDDSYDDFISSYLTFDKNNTPGMRVYENDLVKINSGIKVKLEPGTAGIFFNKSGRGTKGWDVRACVVDEDYTGFVHLSMGFTSYLCENSVIYCGDKFVQMVVLPVVHPTIEELTDDEYAKATSDSERGDNGFGSSNEKH